MNARLTRLLIWLVAVGTLLLCGGVLLQGAAFKPGIPGGPSESFLLLFSSKVMLGAFPGNPAVVLRTYAVAAALAAALALVLVFRSQRGQAALMLSVALANLSFFAAYFVLGRHLATPVVSALLPVFDFVALVALAFGLHAMVRIALCYPRPIDDDAYLAYCRKEFSRDLLPSFNKILPSIARSGATRSVALADRLGVSWYLRSHLYLIRSSWWSAGIAVVGCGLLVASQTAGPGSVEWIDLLGYLLLLGGALPMFELTAAVLSWQYRLGDKAEQNQLTWYYSGVFLFGMICGGCSMGALLAAIGLNKSHGVFLMVALAPPLTAIVILSLVSCGIFFFGAIDSRLAIRKTSVYGIATLLVVAGAAAAENSAVSHLVARFGLPVHSGSMVAGMAVALVLAPMRRRLETGVERAIDQVLPASALASAQRETTTVVFADLSGYTELSATDETSALTLASLLHKESRRLAERHGGRLVKTIGDAVLLSFHEPGEAVVACSELREKFAAAVGALDLPVLFLHFGVHTGEVVRDKDGDIFGGSVNLAARLLGVAKPGEIVVSEQVANALKDGNFTLQTLGTKTLKNVPTPVNCFLVV